MCPCSCDAFQCVSVLSRDLLASCFGFREMDLQMCTGAALWLLSGKKHINIIIKITENLQCIFFQY